MEMSFIKRIPTKLWEAMREFEDGNQFYVFDCGEYCPVSDTHMLCDEYKDIYIQVPSNEVYVDPDGVSHWCNTIDNFDELSDFIRDLSNDPACDGVLVRYTGYEDDDEDEYVDDNGEPTEGLNVILRIKDVNRLCRDYGMGGFSSWLSSVSDMIDYKCVEKVK